MKAEDKEVNGVNSGFNTYIRHSCSSSAWKWYVRLSVEEQKENGGEMQPLQFKRTIYSIRGESGNSGKNNIHLDPR